MRIAYFPAGTDRQASSRLRVWRVGAELARRGHEVAYNVPPAPGYDIAVFQKWLHRGAEMDAWRAAGATVIWDIDDLLLPGPVAHADMVTTDTAGHAAHYPGARVIPDALDWDDGPVKGEHRDEMREVCWFGNADNVHHARNVARACRELGLSLTIITNLDLANLAAYDWEVRGARWQPDSVDAEIIRHDVAICSYVVTSEWVRTKSRNRLLKAWALGMPVAGTPIPDYVEAGLRHQAETVEEWIATLEALRDRKAREADAARGRHIALRHTAARIAGLWEALFEEARGEHRGTE